MIKQKFRYGRLLFAITASLGGIAVANAACVPVKPRPPAPAVTISPDGKTTTVITPEGAFPPQDPFLHPPGSNHLPTIYENYCDGNGVEILNTVPSTPEHPYNLHPDPVVSEIDKASPSDDLITAFKQLTKKPVDKAAIQRAIDILEGNPIPGRNYSGLPVLHYKGPEKVKVVTPTFDSNGIKTGGIVDIHQIWYGDHIESDTAFVDPSAVLDVPWTIRYTVDTLNQGHEDFAPMVMYFDDPALSPPGSPPMPNVMFDQTFFPMNDGTRTVYEIAMGQGKYYNLSYHWGWRKHPPRVQVTENARKKIGGVSLPEFESNVFGPHPSASEAEKLAAIAKIGDLAPEKRMWNTLQVAKANGRASVSDIVALNRAFDQWQNRNKLPDGVKLDPDSDWTLFFVNNTIYGEIKGNTIGGHTEYDGWTTRGKTVKIKLLNGDHFDHAYFNIDFGGRRGWENTFQSTKAIGGAGQWFTFGRANWWVNAGFPVMIITPPATGTGASTVVGEHNVVLTMNFEPSRRIRWYQFDPFHHDTAVWSIH
ncbi:hypothetical protein MGMO_177c00130 [Methyloglobulus morosus KoM1]|uniref:Uncharacterized protein n=1 Tax=Methyloglobulus morosus KoM1 TaxID=1116472 RepID=V5BKR0_9GAMM|nr:hypothetical protein [Methyloglobulus morosus]ESS66722.1 hypothetical protein MGMO_177c00130 [Methyloglobulus morosus KoM1]